MSLKAIQQAIIDDPDNEWARKLGYMPVYTASTASKIILVGQAPGRKAQDSMTPWNDMSGDRLRAWLRVSREEFYDTKNFALIPMDFYYPGKGAHGDLPPRKHFAPKWHPLLLAEMRNVSLILPIGWYAQKYYLGTRVKQNLTHTVAAYTEFLPDFLPLVHPSPLNFRWRSQNPWFEKEVVPVASNLVRSILDR